MSSSAAAPRASVARSVSPSAGARVHLVDRDGGVAAVGKETGMEAHVADLADRDETAGLVGKVSEGEGRLDILALAAGGVCGLADLPLDNVTPENWEVVFGANVKSALWLSQAAAPIMTEAGWGRIVIISSGAGLRPSLTGLHAYTSAKHAVIGLTRQLSVGLAKHGITANSIAPGLRVIPPAVSGHLLPPHAAALGHEPDVAVTRALAAAIAPVRAWHRRCRGGTTTSGGGWRCRAAAAAYVGSPS